MAVTAVTGYDFTSHKLPSRTRAQFDSIGVGLRHSFYATSVKKWLNAIFRWEYDMQVAVYVTKLSAREYFALGSGLFRDWVRTDRVVVYWTELPGLDIRFVLLVAPKGRCWGIPWRGLKITERDVAWENTIGESPDVSQALKVSLSAFGLKPSQVPMMLTGFGDVGSNGDRLRIGDEVDDLPFGWFQSIPMPRGEAVFSEFYEQFTRYLGCLGGFMLILAPNCEDKSVLAWSESIDSRLEC